MFGLTSGELAVLAAVAVLVFLPRNLPTVLRALGRLIGELRR